MLKWLRKQVCPEPQVCPELDTVDGMRIPAPIPRVEQAMHMKRGVGYCTNVGSVTEPGCDDYSKGVFLLNHGDTFHCPKCRKPGLIVRERGFVEAREERPFKEVRVEYNYDPVEERYREIAIVRDEAIWGTGNKYILMSPLIKTEKRALKVAEAVLANLQRSCGDSDDIPKTTEIILSLDDEFPEFCAKVRRLGEEWGKSTLSKQMVPASK